MAMQTIYPTLVIALVNNHHTFDYMYSANGSLPTISHDLNPQHTTTIQFAQPGPATSMRLSQQGEKSNNIQEIKA